MNKLHKVDWFKILISIEIISVIICLIATLTTGISLIFSLCSLIICLINMLIII